MALLEPAEDREVDQRPDQHQRDPEQDRAAAEPGAGAVAVAGAGGAALGQPPSVRRRETSAAKVGLATMAKKLLTAKAMRRINEGGVEVINRVQGARCRGGPCGVVC